MSDSQIRWGLQHIFTRKIQCIIKTELTLADPSEKQGANKKLFRALLKWENGISANRWTVCQCLQVFYPQQIRCFRRRTGFKEFFLYLNLANVNRHSFDVRLFLTVPYMHLGCKYLALRYIFYAAGDDKRDFAFALTPSIQYVLLKTSFSSIWNVGNFSLRTIPYFSAVCKVQKRWETFLWTNKRCWCQV